MHSMTSTNFSGGRGDRTHHFRSKSPRRSNKSKQARRRSFCHSNVNTRIQLPILIWRLINQACIEGALPTTVRRGDLRSEFDVGGQCFGNRMPEGGATEIFQKGTAARLVLRLNTALGSQIKSGRKRKFGEDRAVPGKTSAAYTG